ncbi:nitroreductase family protein [Streptomyces sp. NPDC048337]|uniref:nitroreductase family protein n=1 Tax=Streptomyces sp. NPDC048337 TaxID=3365535 RepID=UPI003710E1D5
MGLRPPAQVGVARGAFEQRVDDQDRPLSGDVVEDLDARGLLCEYAVKDAVIAASFLMPAATERGRATSPMNGWDEEEVKKVIGIDGREDLAVALLVSLGHPAEARRHPGRRPVGRNVFRERCGHPGI